MFYYEIFLIDGTYAAHLYMHEITTPLSTALFKHAGTLKKQLLCLLGY